ncbi:ABC transporter permease [Glutamicibacter ardleyensis]|uniref:ABC transporter permease n=1 Tax=Glutamicibacter ardleyensis TaxID=225894 RepID=UPI003FD00398
MTTPTSRRQYQPLLRLIIRILAWAGTLLAVCFLVFIVLGLLPGDAASGQLGMKATPEALAALREEYGLNRPILFRFAEWLGGVFRGDLGTVLSTGRPVAELLAGPLSRSATLVLIAGIGITLLGVGGGILAGTHSGTRGDGALSALALAVLCTPEFVIGTLLVRVFATGLGVLPAVSLLPVGGGLWERSEILVLPSLSIILIGSAMLLRQVRAITAQQAVRPHVEAARLSGLPETQVLLRHLLPGAAPAILQSAAAIVPYLIGGTVVIERVFSFPGLGSALVAGVSNREPDVLMACVLIIVAITLLAYFLADTRGRKVQP